ncbi:cell division protein ZapA, partial [Paenibacillus sonchi]
MDRTRVAVEIYGTSYKLVGSSTEYMKQVARYVDEHMRAISKSHTRLDTPRIAVLAAVHMAEQAIQVQDFKNELNMLTGERTELRVEVARLTEAQKERQEEYERLEAAAREEAARLAAE